MSFTFLSVFLLLMASSALAQTRASQLVSTPPVYAITPVPQPVSSVHYRPSTPIHVDFGGTWLLPKAHGEAQVSTVPGGLQVELQIKGLSDASDLGPAYLTYVLWAATPDGKPRNMGEIVLKGSTGMVAAKTDLSAFAMFVTAEPYYAVTEPSDAVVLRNAVPQGLLRYKSDPSLLPLLRDRETPLDLVEARNAVRIARRSGAERLASVDLQRAVALLSEAERQYHHDDRERAVLKAREAIEAAEAARQIAASASAE